MRQECHDNVAETLIRYPDGARLLWAIVIPDGILDRIGQAPVCGQLEAQFRVIDPQRLLDRDGDIDAALLASSMQA